MLIRYEKRDFKPRTLEIIEQANRICEEYSGFSLTLRQLWYQHVARGLLDDGSWYVDPASGTNNQRNYNRLGEIIFRFFFGCF